MPRIRTIKPDAFLSESLAGVPRGTRWTFAGLWTYADDAGRARDDARLVKAALYPLDDEVTQADVKADLKMLANIGAICRYVVDGKNYLHMPGWHHQKINRPTPAKSPPCPMHEGGMSGHGSVDDASVSDHGVVSEPSGGERKGKGREVEREEEGEWSSAEGADAPRPLALVSDDRPDVDRICDHLADRIAANGSKRPTITAKWRDAARLMLDRDQRTEEEIHGAIDWCQADEFWRGNVLSLPKLREKFDQLRLQAQRRGLSSNGPRRGDIDWDAAMERAKQIDANGGLR